MKKTIAILLVLVIAMAGVFAATSAEVEITTTVTEFTHIGITDKDTDALVATAFDSSGDFTGAVESEVVYTDEDFATLDVFETETLIAHVWGITNTIAADLTITISTNGFVGQTDATSIIPLKLNGVDDTTTMTLPKAVGGALGVLNSSNELSIIEKTTGSIALAPAQAYVATITIEITT